MPWPAAGWPVSILETAMMPWLLGMMCVASDQGKWPFPRESWRAERRVAPGERMLARIPRHGVSHPRIIVQPLIHVSLPLFGGEG